MAEVDPPPPPVRLAELLGGLSLACDVVNGFPHGKVVRTALLSSQLARHAGHDDEIARDALYTTLLRFLGCTGFAHEEAASYGAGDDQAVRNVMAFADVADPIATVKSIAKGVAAHAPVIPRMTAVARLLGDGVAAHRHAQAQCDTSTRLAQMIGASDRVVAALAAMCERWDGRGEPSHLTGEALAVAMRLHHVADVAELALHRHGAAAVLDVLGRRAGRHLDPALVAVFRRHGGELLEMLEGPDTFARFLDSEPAPHAVASAETIDEVARALGRFVDLKSVFTLGHSAGVAELARATATQLGVSSTAVRTLVRAADLHDLGRLSVPNGIWDRPGRLDFADLERVRLHSYYTDRILAHVEPLRAEARIAAAAHERLDGGGYHRGVGATSLPREARILAACDVAQAMGEQRPHRPALTPSARTTELLREVKAGRLDATVVDAMLASLGDGAAPSPRRRAGLSDREIEVLRLVAVGKSNKEIAVILGISPKTVQHHVAHAYEKTGVYSRAGAALYVMEHGLGG